MRLRAIVPGLEFQALVEAEPQAERRITSSKLEIRKDLINSDEHLEWQVFHAQPRFGLQRISRTDHGKPRAAVLQPAGVCIRLGSPSGGPPHGPDTNFENNPVQGRMAAG